VNNFLKKLSQKISFFSYYIYITMPHMYNHTDANRSEMKKTSKGMKRKTPTNGIKNKPKNPIKKKKTMLKKKKTISY